MRARLKVIGIVGIHGGGGKTSAAVPLAVQAAKLGPTVLVDLDSSHHASMWTSAAGLQSACLAVHESSAGALPNLLKASENAGFEWAVVDAPPGDRRTALTTMLESDLVLIPVCAGPGQMIGLSQTLVELAKARHQKRRLRELAVITRTTAATTMTRDTRLTIEDAGVWVARTEIPSLQMYGRASGNVPQGKHYPELWAEIMEHLEGSRTERVIKGSAMDRLARLHHAPVGSR